MMKRAFRAAAAALALAGLAESALARPIVPSENRYYDFEDDLPACDASGVLDFIKGRFSVKESEYWNTSLEIVSFDRVKLITNRPWGLDHIPRHYCIGRALLNDNSYHDVSYAVVATAGIIGFDWGVEWCLQGLDRNLAFAPNCQLARP